MKKIAVCKAEKLVDREDVENVTIEISGKLPPSEDRAAYDYQRPGEGLFKRDAVEIFSALKRSLPQGTRYQLLLLLLEDAPIFYRGR